MQMICKLASHYTTRRFWST